MLYGGAEFTYSVEQSPSWEASKEIPRIYAIRRFIIAFTTARHLSVFWTRGSVQFRGLVICFVISLSSIFSLSHVSDTRENSYNDYAMLHNDELCKIRQI